MHAFDRQTDGRTDRIPIAIPRLHSMQRGKNVSWAKSLQWQFCNKITLYAASTYRAWRLPQTRSVCICFLEACVRTNASAVVTVFYGTPSASSVYPQGVFPITRLTETRGVRRLFSANVSRRPLLIRTEWFAERTVSNWRVKEFTYGVGSRHE